MPTVPIKEPNLGERVMTAFWRLHAAVARVDAIDKQHTAAKDELAAAQAEMQALARKGGA